ELRANFSGWCLGIEHRRSMSGALLRRPGCRGVEASREAPAPSRVCSLARPGRAKTAALRQGLRNRCPKIVRGPGVSRGLSTERAVPGSAPTVVGFGGLLHGLAVKRDIEALLLDLGGHAKPDEDVDDLENDQRHDHVVDDYGADADRLVDHLHRIALEQPRV